MNTQKLTEALVEMKHQRALLDAAIKNLEGILASLDGTSAPVSASTRSRKPEIGSYIDLGEQILAESGKPMHIAGIAAKISDLRGKNIPRANVESSFLRHIQTSKDAARIIKVRPAYFGLAAWKTLLPNLVA